MAEKGADDWALEERPLADVVGLDAEAEWLLGSGTTGGEARKLFLSDTLTADYEFRTYPERELLPLEADRDKGGRPPFSLLISPEPGGNNGKDILRVLKCIAEPEAEYAKDDGSDDAPAERLIMSMAEQQVLRTTALPARSAISPSSRPRSRRRISGSSARSSGCPRRCANVPSRRGSFSTSRRRTGWSRPFRQPGRTSPKNGSETVVVGVIDDSFAIGHPRFQFTDGRSRIFSYWDQEADVEPHDPTVLFGRELLSFNPKDLDDFNANWPDLPGLDCFLKTARNEKRPVAEFYSLPAPRLRPFYPPRPMDALRLASHGTHVLDLAAGAPSQPPLDLKGLPKEQGADAAPALVLVKLPRASVQDTSGAHLEFYLMQGVRHIVSRARMIDPGCEGRDRLELRLLWRAA